MINFRFYFILLNILLLHIVTGDNFIDQIIQERINNYNIEELNPLREGKKLLVLDIDHTLLDDRSNAKRPCLHEFLTKAYKNYDIVIWSATKMIYIERKMNKFKINNNPNYKIAFCLDILAMVPIRLKKFKFINVKPLALIWGKYKQFSPKNTIMIDDLKTNFILNPQSGLFIKPFYKKTNVNTTDYELLKMSKYLEIIANFNDFQKLNHSLVFI
ncbi:ubiquitin-like domain-containing CTD phosphatase 1 [Leptopilina boulardi]|uniref:ubiquitin-like domain-containing CTD phosphatase 1 n=1 Tax=Leptopilina boulardi TaxID=63433 RepID=UPI0021F58A97|nr:ubiquitin-like domain-containing CTD phosphatase 1 [Leptopilina boulardi]